MRSPDEYEAAFYSDTTNANLDITVKVEKQILEPPMNLGILTLRFRRVGISNNGGLRAVSHRLRKQICRALPVA